MGNAFIVGDVHGNYPKLKAALQTYGYREGDDVIFVGDLMCGGPQCEGNVAEPPSGKKYFGCRLE